MRKLRDVLKALRISENLTQRGTSKKLDMPYQHWQKYEYGTQAPNVWMLVRLKKTFPHIDLNNLLDVEDEA